MYINREKYIYFIETLQIGNNNKKRNTTYRNNGYKR